MTSRHPAVGYGVLELTTEPRPLALAADQHALEVACDGLRASDHVEQPEGLDGLGLSLQRERLHGRDAHGVADEQPRLGAEQHLACGRRLLEARSHVDGVPGDERLALAADHDFACVDADSRLRARGRHDRLPHLPRRAHRTQRVVLVGDGYAEDGHHRVADELLDRAAVPLEDRAEICEVAAHARPERLGIGGLAERGRPTRSQKSTVTTFR